MIFFRAHTVEETIERIASGLFFIPGRTSLKKTETGISLFWRR